MEQAHGVLVILTLFGYFCVGAKTPRLDVATTADHGGTLTISCLVEQDFSLIQSIEIGKSALAFQARTILASIGSNNQIVNHGTGNNVGVEGHLDSSAFATAFLRLKIHHVDCSQKGSYYCSVNGGVQIVEKSVTICDDMAGMTIVMPDKFDPTNAKFICALAENVTGVSNVSYIAIYRILVSNSKRESIAYANFSESDGKVQAFSSFIQNGVHLSGQLDPTNPKDSKVQVNLQPGSCDDAGTYRCQVVYTQVGSKGEQFALAEGVLSNPCTSSLVSISLQQTRTSDPTGFRINCGFVSYTPQTYWNNMYIQSNTFSTLYKALDLELSVLADQPASRELRRQVAFWDTFSQNQDLVITDDYIQRGFSSSGSPSSRFDFASGVGLCTDAGVYRCKGVYTRSDVTDFSPVVAIAEARLPACTPGAVFSVMNESTNYTFKCTVDPSKVTQLFSLEISQVMDRTLKVITSINSYLNNARPAVQLQLFSVSGEIYPSDPASSFLSITSLPQAEGGALKTKAVPTRCKAVFVGVASQAVVESYADGVIRS